MSSDSFPENIMQEIKVAMETHLDDHRVILRPLRPSDPAKSISIFLTDAIPMQETAQIGQLEPTLQRYTIRIQNLIIAAEEETGRSLFSAMAKTLRVVLYRDTALHVRLRELTEEVLGTRERVQRFGVARQSFVNNELRGQWFFVGSTDFWVETEMIELG